MSLRQPERHLQFGARIPDSALKFPLPLALDNTGKADWERRTIPETMIVVACARCDKPVVPGMGIMELVELGDSAASLCTIVHRDCRKGWH